MRLKYVFGLLVFAVGCEQALNSPPGFTGTWNAELVMLDNEEIISQITGEMSFFADNTARLSIENELGVTEVEYLWFNEETHLLLVNKETNFALPYHIEHLSPLNIDLQQGDNVKLSLSR